MIETTNKKLIADSSGPLKMTRFPRLDYYENYETVFNEDEESASNLIKEWAKYV